jgi:hypothetical protein
MVSKLTHLSDEQLLLVADGEASRGESKQARAHLAVCWACRSRLAELEETIADFISLQQQTPDPSQFDASGPRALLKARLSEAAALPPENQWIRFLRSSATHRALASGCAAIVLTFLGGRVLLQHFDQHRQHFTVADLAVPDRALTPGATRAVSVGEVCSVAHEEVVRAVPNDLSRLVFKEYGIVNPRLEDYEIDYLIAPGLGGTEDIHNLWPEPSNSSTWNAHVKDALEERLHRLVCDGKVDLPTAQQAIATNWISAYKKYLGDDRFVSQVTQAAEFRPVVIGR